jgi:hypothetical protein
MDTAPLGLALVLNTGLVSQLRRLLGFEEFHCQEKMILTPVYVALHAIMDTARRRPAPQR